MSTPARKHAAAAVLLLLALLTTLVLLAKPSGVAAADPASPGTNPVVPTVAVACSGVVTSGGVARVSLANPSGPDAAVSVVVAVTDPSTGTVVAAGTPVIVAVPTGATVGVQLADPVSSSNSIMVSDLSDTTAPAVTAAVPTAPDATVPGQNDLVCDPAAVAAPALSASISASYSCLGDSAQTATVGLTMATVDPTLDASGTVDVVRLADYTSGTAAAFSVVAANSPTSQPVTVSFPATAASDYVLEATLPDGTVQSVSTGAPTAFTVPTPCPVPAPATTAPPTTSAAPTTASSSASASASRTDTDTPTAQPSDTPTPSATAPIVTDTPTVPVTSPEIIMPPTSLTPSVTKAPSPDATAPIIGPTAAVSTSAANVYAQSPDSRPSIEPTASVLGPTATVATRLQLPLLAEQPSTSKPAVRLLAWHQDAALIVGIDAVAVSALVGATVWSARRR